MNSILLFLLIAAMIMVGVAEPLLVQLLFFFFSVVFPKFPILEIRGFLVPIRTEDFFLVLVFVVLLLRWLIYGEKFARHPLLKWMAIYCGATFLSYLFGVLILGSVTDAKIGFLYWLRGLEYFAASFLCLIGIRSWSRFRNVIIAFVICVALIGIYGVLQEFGIVPAIDTMHTTDEVIFIRFIPSFGEDRLFSTFSGPYDLSAFYLVAVPIMLALLASVKNHAQKALLVAILLLSALCFYLTYARTPLLALAVSLVVCFVLLGKPRLGITLAVIGVVPPFFWSGFQQRLVLSLSDPTAGLALGGRLEGPWAEAIDAWLRSPVVGIGPWAFGSLMGVDSLYLLLLSTWGTLGFACFVVLIYKTLQYQKKAIVASQNEIYRAFSIGMYSGTIGLLVDSFTVDTFLGSKIAFSFWFLMGLMFAGSQLSAQYLPNSVGKLVRRSVFRRRPISGRAPAPQRA